MREQRGFALVALMATIAIMLIMMTAAVPSWRYVMKNDAEQELIFRGGEIADAIARYQRKNGNALPLTLEVLVKGKYLRRAYKDPMTKDGEWRFIRPGEAVGAVRPPGAPGAPGAASTTRTTPTPTPTPTPTRSSGIGTTGTTLGAIQGVASKSTEKSLRMFNGRTRYDEWVFLPGQPRVVGRPVGPVAPAGPGRPPGGAVPGAPPRTPAKR